jgi:hypothetical protein
MSTTTSSFIDDTFDAVQEMLEEEPDYSSPRTMVAFITTILTALIFAITETYRKLHFRVLSLEKASSTSAPSKPAQAPSTSSVSGPTTQRDTAAAAQRQARCTQCHARGHTANLCRTSNPAAMRKRVARNSRIAKEARTLRNMPTIPAPAPPPFLYPAPTHPVGSIPMDYASLTADATELRRRSAQSARDKRLRRRAQSSTS